MDNNNLESVLGEYARLMENEIKETHRAYSNEKLESHGIFKTDKRYTDSIDVISNYLNHQCSNLKLNGDKPSDFYCGITNDVVARKDAHERDDYAGKKIALMVAVQCKNASIAERVEVKMHDEYGFYIGETQTMGNGAAEDSDYVYIYRIPK